MPADLLAAPFTNGDTLDGLSVALSDAVFVLHRDGEVVYAGPAVRALLGVDPESVVGRPFLDLVHPSDRVREEAGGFWTAAPPFERELRVRLASGEWAWVRAASASEAAGRDGAWPEAVRHALDGHVLLLVRELALGAGIRDPEDLLRRAFGVVKDLVVVTDARLPDHPIVFVNERFLEATGYARVDVVGRNCRFLQTRADGTRDAGDGDDEQARALATLRAAVAGGAPAEVVFRNYRRDGSLFYNRLALTPVRDAAGATTHIIGVQTDVTREVALAAEADTQRRVLESFFESAPFGMGVLEIDGGALRHRAANATAVALFGSDGAAFARVEGETLAALGFTDAEAEQWYGHVLACARTRGPARFETAFPWGATSGAEGVRDLAVVVNATSGPDPTFSYVVEDVSEARARARARRLLAAAAEHAGESILVTGPTRGGDAPTILYANRAHERLSGYTRDEVLGQTPRMFQGPKTDRGVLDRVRRALAAGEPVRAETVNYRKDGTEFCLEWEMAPVLDDAGRVANWVGTQRDVTERRRLEQEILEVGGRVQEQMARELHDGLGQVLTGAAIRLHIVKRALAARADAALAPDAAAPDAALVFDVARAGELVAEALAHARAIAHGLFPVHVKPDGLVPALERLAADVAADGEVRCTVACDAPVRVRSAEHAGHLYRVVQEAVTNALRHGCARTVTVMLRHEDDGDVALTIQDDGVGIADEALDGARGIGLRTMAYRARRIGGVLDVRRLDAGGTIVRVRLAGALPNGGPGWGSAPARRA